MLQRFAGQLPPWARSEHPVLRYGLGKTREIPRRARFLRALSSIILVLVFFGGGYLAATDLLRREAPGSHATESLLAILFWPVLIVQLFTRASVISLTVNMVNEEVRRQTWDSLRATEMGVELALRARWVSVFYRLRPLIAVLIMVRLILIAGILVDLTAFRGGFLDRLLNGVVPEVSLLFSVVLLAFLMTASLLLPLTGIGLDAALGLLVSTTVRQRVYTTILQVILIGIRIGVVVLLLVAMTQFNRGELTVRDGLAWLLVGGFAAMGDWAVSLLHLSYYGELWAIIPYGIFLGVALLVFVLVQAVLTDLILGYAVRQAERRG